MSRLSPSNNLPKKSEVTRRNWLTGEDEVALDCVYESDETPGALFYTSSQDGVEYPVGVGINGPDTRNVDRYSEFLVANEIPADTPINTNAATGAFTTVIDSAGAFTGHSTGATAAEFNTLYPAIFEAAVDGQRVPQGDVYRNSADPAGFVRFSVIIPDGSTMTFRTTRPENA